MPDETEDYNVLSDEAYDQRSELDAMSAPGALERIDERNKQIAERLTPKGETAPADVPYVTWIPSEERAGLGMQMGIRMEEYRAGIQGFGTKYMRFVFDEVALEASRLRYQEADGAALETYRDAMPTPAPPTPPGLLSRLFPWVWFLKPKAGSFDARAHAAAYRVLKETRKKNVVTWEKSVVAAIRGTTSAGEPDIESLDPRTDFYKLMTSHKGMRAAQLVELGKMGRTEKKPQRRGFLGFGAPR